jgi:hypothetical protein
LAAICASYQADLVRVRSVLRTPGVPVFLQPCYNRLTEIKQEKSEEKTAEKFRSRAFA